MDRGPSEDVSVTDRLAAVLVGCRTPLFLRWPRGVDGAGGGAARRGAAINVPPGPALPPVARWDPALGLGPRRTSVRRKFRRTVTAPGRRDHNVPESLGRPGDRETSYFPRKSQNAGVEDFQGPGVPADSEPGRARAESLRHRGPRAPRRPAWRFNRSECTSAGHDSTASHGRSSRDSGSGSEEFRWRSEVTWSRPDRENRSPVACGRPASGMRGHSLPVAPKHHDLPSGAGRLRAPLPGGPEPEPSSTPLT